MTAGPPGGFLGTRGKATPYSMVGMGGRLRLAPFATLLGRLVPPAGRPHLQSARAANPLGGRLVPQAGSRAQYKV